MTKARRIDPEMRIADSEAPGISFEFFPPKTEKMEQVLWQSIRRLEPLGPRFVSVTYGAGGSTRGRTHATVTRLLRETALVPAAHLTCVGAPRQEIDQIAHDYWDAGIRHIVALRGDAPVGVDGYRPFPGGYAYASDLVAGLRQLADFEISVAAYPEIHPDADNLQSEIDNLKRKIDAGANRAITQYFFEVEIFLRFLDHIRAAGIDIPVVPGILPVTNFQQVIKFSAACGCKVPVWLAQRFEGLEDDPEIRKLVAASTAVQQCRRLQKEEVNEFHIYTLNRAELAYAISHMLGLRPWGGETRHGSLHYD